MPHRSSGLIRRTGHVSAHELFIHASIVAAHGTTGRTTGFSASDVRFFFRLFTNWVEHDVMRPGQDLELTQVRRTMESLVESGLAKPRGRKTKDENRRAPRGALYTLTTRGLATLVDAIVDPQSRRPFDEMLFVIVFAASYGQAIVARVDHETDALPPAARKRLRERLDPVRLVHSARATLDTLLHDLDERTRSGASLARDAAQMMARSVSHTNVVKALEQKGAYQLHHVRTYSELMTILPDDVALFELERGMRLRVDLLFSPMAEQVRAQRRILDQVAGHLAK